MRSIGTNGYVIVGWALPGNVQLKIYEHRYVMGNPVESVHHKNGVKTDNRLENLEVLSHAEHMRLHLRKEWDRDKAVELYKSGWAYRDVSRIMGIPPGSVKLALDEAGVWRPRGSRYANERMRASKGSM